MKISQMLEREDFYTINEKTLSEYFTDDGGKTTVLCIYPQLNAIVTQNPSKQVIDYLLCEYSVCGNLLKRLAVRSYVLGCLKSFGLFASKKCTVCSMVGSDLLIYPCNKKYRIFDFNQNIVDVIAKYGFDDTDLQHEIAFRRQPDLPDFVPGFVSYSSSSYRERIIDGRPLARITDGFSNICNRAYQLLRDYGAAQEKMMSTRLYADSLQAEILQLVQKKVGNAECVEPLVKTLVSYASENEGVTLTFSHGDLQAGNIWIENDTEKIYIIDWESWGIRSVWYDKATLFEGLRPGDIQGYLEQNVARSERAVVLLEDMVFHLNELNSLPEEFGICNFIEYCNKIAQWLETGEKNGK